MEELLLALGSFAGYAVTVRASYRVMAARDWPCVRDGVCVHGYTRLHERRDCRPVNVEGSRAARRALSLLGPLLVLPFLLSCLLWWKAPLSPSEEAARRKQLERDLLKSQQELELDDATRAMRQAVHRKEV